MSKREPFYDSLVYKDYSLVLPSDEAERKETARALLGAVMVACIDVLIEDAEKIVENYTEFADFTEEQKEKVLSLVKHTSYGVLYWQCVKLDRFYGAGLEINVVEQNGEEEPWRSTRIVGPTEDELKFAYFDWAERFGDYYEDREQRYAPGLQPEHPTA